MNNGDGLRVVLWLSGCTHKCKNCQNPQTWDPDGGIRFDEEAKEELLNELGKDHISGLTLSGGDPLAPWNLDPVLDLVTEIKNPHNFQTPSSENPRKQLVSEAPKCNERPISFAGKSIWIYSGYTWEEIFEESKIIIDGYTAMAYECFEKRKNIISQCDVFVDGRYIDSKKNVSLKWRGSSNQRVIAVKKSLQQGDVVLWCD